MEKKIALIQTDLVDKGLVEITRYQRLSTYLMLCEIEGARMGNNLDFTKTNPSMWLPISTLPTITYENLFKFISLSEVETDKFKKLMVESIRSNDDSLPDYVIINYDEGKYKELIQGKYEGLTLNDTYSMYIRHTIREIYNKEI